MDLIRSTPAETNSASYPPQTHSFAAETVSLSLSTPSPADRSTTASGSPGFLEGLRGGWHAFVAVVAWLLTALGAVLPFIALAAAVTLPVVAWRRRRTASEEATAAAGDPAVPEEEKRPTVTS